MNWFWVTIGAVKFNIEQRVDYIALIVKGNFNVEGAHAGFQRLLANCRRTGSTAALVDFTDLLQADSATLRVIFAVEAIALYQRYLDEGGQRIRMAFLAGDAGYLSWQPGMEVAAGMAVATFTDLAEAETWLVQAA